MRNTTPGTPTPENSRLPTLVRWFRRLEDGVLVVALIAMIGTAVLQILLRIFFHTGIAWADEFVRMLVLWVGFLGALSASRDDTHIRIDLTTRYLPDRLKKVAGGVGQLATSVICTLTAWFGWQFVRIEFEAGTPAFASVPAWICESIIPFGFAVLALRYVVLSINQFKSAWHRTAS